MEIIGYVDHVIYRKAETGYTVFILVSEGDEITCVGTLGQIDQGDNLLIEGEEIAHVLYIEIHIVSVVFSVCTGIQKKACGIVFPYKIAYFADTGSFAGFTDFVANTVNHQRRMVIQSLNMLKQCAVADKIFFTLKHFF